MHIPGADGPDQDLLLTDTKGKSYQHGASFGGEAEGDILFLRSGVMNIRHDKQTALPEKLFIIIKVQSVLTALPPVAGIPMKS